MMAILSLSFWGAKSLAQEDKPQPKSTQLQQDVQSALVNTKLDAAAIDVGEVVVQSAVVSQLPKERPLLQSAQKKSTQTVSAL